jgi:hypothetical protein
MPQKFFSKLWPFSPSGTAYHPIEDVDILDLESADSVLDTSG